MGLEKVLKRAPFWSSCSYVLVTKLGSRAAVGVFGPTGSQEEVKGAKEALRNDVLHRSGKCLRRYTNHQSKNHVYIDSEIMIVPTLNCCIGHKFSFASIPCMSLHRFRY